MELTPNKKRKESDKKMMNGSQRLEVLHTHTHTQSYRKAGVQEFNNKYATKEKKWRFKFHFFNGGK